MTPPPADRPLRTRSQPPFVGRREELRWLQGGIDSALAGHPSLSLVAGEAGIGKTRLIRRFGDLERARVDVHVGRGYENLTLPYLPFIELIESWLEHAPAERIEALGADGERLRRLVHARAEGSSASRVGSDGTGNTDGSAEADAGHRVQLFLAVSRAMVHLARERAALLVIEDAHWIDRASLDLLEYLVFGFADAAASQSVPIALAVTFRSDGPGERLERLLARVRREPLCQELELQGLEAEDVGRLVRAAGMRDAPDRLLGEVSRLTGGNPLYVQETARLLVSQQEAADTTRGAAGMLELSLPADLRAAITARVNALPDDVCELLTVAAFVGDRFDLETLRATSGGRDIERALEAGLEHGVLVPDPVAGRFAHPSIREVFFARADPARRQQLHEQVASVLERVHAPRVDEYELEIADHRLRAGSAVEPGLRIQSAVRAGDRCFRILAWGEAARFFAAAARSAEASNLLAADERALLHYRAGLSHYRDTEPRLAAEHYDRANALYRDLGDVTGVARVAAEQARLQLTQLQVDPTRLDVEGLLEICDQLPVDADPLRGRLLARISEAHWVRGETAAAMQAGQRGLECGTRANDDSVRTEGYTAIALAQLQQLEVREAVESYRHSLEHAHQTDDVWTEGWPLPRLALSLYSLGELEEASKRATQACDSTLAAQDWSELSLALGVQTMLAAMRGDQEGTEQYSRRCFQMIERSHYPWGGAIALPAVAGLRAAMGESQEALDALDLLAKPGAVFDQPDAGMVALVDLHRRVITAGASFPLDWTPPSVEVEARDEPYDSIAVGYFCALAELADRAGQPELAAPAYPRLALAVERGLVFPSGWVCLVPRALGLAAALLGRDDEAEQVLRGAIETAGRLDAEPERARARFDLARVLNRRGLEGDRPEATELLEQAFGDFCDFGLETFAAGCAPLAGELGLRLPFEQAEGPRTETGLSWREAAVLRTTSELDDLDQTASDLLLSPSTLAAHLERIATDTREPSSRVAGPNEPQGMVVICFTDMVGSTTLVHRLGDADAREVMHAHNAILRTTLAEHGGRELQHTGDGLMAVFRLAHPAVDCAIAMQRAVEVYGSDRPERAFEVRIGLHAGEPLPEEGRLFGHDVIAASRICNRAKAGEILVSEAIHGLCEATELPFQSRGRFTLKGFDHRFRLFAVPWAEATAGASE